MSLTFRNDENNKEKNQDEQKSIEQYKSAGTTRNLCFVQPNNKAIFLNYAYLISGEFDPDASAIILTYTTHVVTVRGSNLEGLFENLMHQSARVIACTDKRYENLEDRKEAIISELRIEKN